MTAWGPNRYDALVSKAINTRMKDHIVTTAAQAFDHYPLCSSSSCPPPGMTNPTKEGAIHHVQQLCVNNQIVLS